MGEGALLAAVHIALWDFLYPGDGSHARKWGVHRANVSAALALKLHTPQETGPVTGVRKPSLGVFFFFLLFCKGKDVLGYYLEKKSKKKKSLHKNLNSIIQHT